MDTKQDTKRELWLRLKHYHFDHLVPPHMLDRVRAAFSGHDAFTQAFADKLARKLHWRVPFGMRAIDEYRKFLYLGVISDFPVTPAKVIDQVWHEHLLFSRGYREFCDAVLLREFDHHPELVPMDDQTEEFQAQYAATLALYKAEFNREAPEAFWGRPKFKGEPKANQRPKAKRRDDVVASYDDTPLYLWFADDSGGSGGSSDGGSHHSAPEFGGGTSGGAGGGGDFGDPGSHGGHGDAGADSSGGSGGDPGAGSDGGSGCSSGCGSGGDCS